MNVSRKQFIYPLATRRKMRDAKLGKKLSDAHKRAISRGVRNQRQGVRNAR